MDNTIVTFLTRLAIIVFSGTAISLVVFRKNKFSEFLLKIFNDNRNSHILFIVCLTLALGLRVKYEIASPNINSDYYMQAAETENFIDGHGFTNSIINLNNISEAQYINHYHEAIGLSIILVPLYYLTGNLINSLVLVQVISIVLLLLVLIRIFKILELSKLAISLFLLFTAYSLFYEFSFTTDKLSAALFLWGIVLTMEICKEENRNGRRNLLAGFLLFLAASLRYAYIPDIIIIPAFFVFFAFIKKDRKIFFTGMEILAYAAIPTFTLFSIYKTPHELNFADNLIHFHFADLLGSLKLFSPFLSRAFFNPYYIYFRIPMNHIFKFFMLSEYLISAVILFYLGWYFLIKRNLLAGLKNKNPMDVFIVLSCISFPVIVTFLLLETLSVDTEVAGQTRYFNVLIFMMLILFFAIMDDVFKKSSKTKTAQIFIVILFVSSMLFSIGTKLTSDKNNYEWNGKQYKFLRAQQESIYYWNALGYKWNKILTLDAEHNPGVNIVIAGYDNNYVNGPPGYARATCVTHKFDSIIDGKFRHSEPVIIYTLMPDSINESERKFISVYKATEVLKCQEGIVYRTFLN
ncbi:MAG: hypothetical protein ACLQQ4_06310 [Bacteroidia bacterium]